MSEDKKTEKETKEPEKPKHSKEDSVIDEGGLPLIGGGGLLKMLHETLLPLIEKFQNKDESAEVRPLEECPMKEEIPFDVLQDNDFDDEDSTVQRFKGNGGVHKIVKIIKISNPEKKLDALASLFEDLMTFRTANRQKTLRRVFSSISAARKGNESEQLNAITSLGKLATDTYDLRERYALLKSQKALESGKDEQLDAAAFRVKNLFADSLPVQQNVRLAYTTLNTQSGEGYLLCPKARHNIGFAMPIEVSKCREQCIDSHVEKDGKVSCQFAKWLKTSSDNQESLNNRFDVQRHPDNAENLLTLQPGERSNPGHIEAEFNSYEHRMDVADSRNPKTYAKSKLDNDTQIEDRLHNKPNGLAKPMKVTDEDRSKIYRSKPDPSLDNKENPGEKNPPRISSAEVHKIDPKKLETMEEQIEESQSKKDVPTNLIENRLDKKGLYNHQGEDVKRPQDMFSKKASFGEDKIDYKSEDSMGGQIDKSLSKNPNLDKTTEQLLEEDEDKWSDDDYDKMSEKLFMHLSENLKK